MPTKSLSKDNYGLVSRLLHKLVLDYFFIAEVIFDIEQVAARQTSRNAGSRPVFIAGLARSGTTALLEKIYATGEFRSLTYKDMPFVLMPSIWRKISGSKTEATEKTERAHGDGILVNAESPEAFEEIFWRSFCANSYIHENCLTPHKADEDTLERFRVFVGSVVSTADDSRQTRYLSKNNNNLLRLPSIRKAFPEAAVIIPFRDPVQQAISLMNQHKLFCERHGKDTFSLKYMNWLAHHEFGLGHKPFQFSGDEKTLYPYKPEDLEYWLSIWHCSYQYILETADEDTYFLCFERLCENTSTELARLSVWADISFGAIDQHLGFVLPTSKRSSGANSGLISSCKQIYQEMLDRTSIA